MDLNTSESKLTIKFYSPAWITAIVCDAALAKEKAQLAKIQNKPK